MYLNVYSVSVNSVHLPLSPSSGVCGALWGRSWKGCDLREIIKEARTRKKTIFFELVNIRSHLDSARL